MFELISQSDPFELRCWVPGYHAPIALVFQFEWHQVSTNWEVDVITRLTLRSDAKTFESSFCTHREQLREFADSLRDISVAKTSNIRLIDDEFGETVLCFSVRDPGLGRITFGGRLICNRFWPAQVSEDRFVTAFKTVPESPIGGVHVTFDGLETDQSYLHQLGTAILWFLNQSTRE